MKTQFFALCLIFVAFAAKGQVKTFAGLQQGDWLELEYITFINDSVPGDIWRAENILKIRLKGTVVRTSKKELALSFKPVHLYRNEISGNSYACYDLKSGERLIVSRTLKEFDELLTPYGFLRVHQSHLVNIGEIKSYIKSDGGYIRMKDGATVSISRQRREMVLKALQQM